MFGLSRHKVAFSAGICGVTALVWGSSGYLPDVGPAPLRFRVMRTPLTNWVSVPAPIPPDQMPVLVESNTLPPIAPIPQSVVSEAVTPEPAPQPQQPVGPPVQQPTVISPQMLVRFFNPHSATNGVAAPQQSVGFNPPIAAPAPAPAPVAPK